MRGACLEASGLSEGSDPGQPLEHRCRRRCHSARSRRRATRAPSGCGRWRAETTECFVLERLRPRRSQATRQRLGRAAANERRNCGISPAARPPTAIVTVHRDAPLLFARFYLQQCMKNLCQCCKFDTRNTAGSTQRTI